MPSFEAESPQRLRRCFALSFEAAGLVVGGISDTFMLLRGKKTIPLFRILFLVCFALILPSCDETFSQAESAEASKTNDVGFEAVIAGSYDGEVSGNGVLVLLLEGGFERQGYFFLSDGQGIRSYGVTFVLPRGLAPGKHTLESPSPLDIGTVPSVRVDRDMGDSVLSSEINTSGFWT